MLERSDRRPLEVVQREGYIASNWSIRAAMAGSGKRRGEDGDIVVQPRVMPDGDIGGDARFGHVLSFVGGPGVTGDRVAVRLPEPYQSGRCRVPTTVAATWRRIRLETRSRRSRQCRLGSRG